MKFYWILFTQCIIYSPGLGAYINKIILYMFFSYLFLFYFTLKVFCEIFGLPRWLGGKESTCQCRSCKRLGLDPWVGKIPRRRKWQPAPGFLLGKFQGQRSLAGYSPRGRRLGHNRATKCTHVALLGDSEILLLLPKGVKVIISLPNL